MHAEFGMAKSGILYQRYKIGNEVQKIPNSTLSSLSDAPAVCF
jgi:hypothetical protein